MRTYTFNTDLATPKNNLIKSVSNPAPAVMPEYTLGETSTHNIYLASPSSASGYDANSGNASLTVKVAIGNPGSVPTSGTFTLTFGGQTTSALSYNSTAAQVQAALQALSSIGTNNVLVTGASPEWDVQFVGSLAFASQALMTSNATALYPFSSINISNEQVGSGSQNAIQSVSLVCQPVVLQTSWTPISQTVANSGLPTGGTYTLSFAGYTTSALAYNATAATIQTALQALASIGSGNALVTGQFPSFNVQFSGSLALSPVPLISAVSSLTPSSIITIANVTTGTATQNAVQSLYLVTTTTSNVGWTGTIALNTAPLQELFTVQGSSTTQASITATMEFQYIDGTGNVTVFASPTVRIYHRVIDASSVGVGPSSGTVSGIVSIANATDTVTVSGLGLAAVPRLAIVGIEKASGGLNLYATVVASSLSTAGFTANLSGMTDATTYKLTYLLVF